MPDTLRLGSRGPDVTRLQQLLNQKLVPSPKLKTDGVFGDGTDDAVRTFQGQQRLAVDGVVGPDTWEKLGATSSLVDVTEPRWMSVARREIGVREFGGKAHNPRIIQYHSTTSLKATTDEIAWCASFVNWCLRQSNLQGTNSAAAASFMNWGIATEARAGAVCVIYNSAAVNSSLSSSGNHVGFLVTETPSSYVLLGGNQRDSVKVSEFPKGKWRMKAMRWPA